MKRDWLTLAFGVALVGTVVWLSLRYNAGREEAAPAPTTESRPPAPAPSAGEPEPPPAASLPSGAAAPLPDRARGRAAAPPLPHAATAAAPETGVTLQVDSDVAGASVFLDREFVGTTPLTLRNLATGSKQLNVTAAGHEGHAETIDLATGANRVTVEFLKVRLNASIPVVHRHAMGSCQGMLAATLKGLAYDTANKADAFTLPFADLHEFEVDYLKKNLRVRRREGRTWNFTNDNADVLFVFHRDVTRARERLATRR